MPTPHGSGNSRRWRVHTDHDVASVAGKAQADRVGMDREAGLPGHPMESDEEEVEVRP